MAAAANAALILIRGAWRDPERNLAGTQAERSLSCCMQGAASVLGTAKATLGI